MLSLQLHTNKHMEGKTVSKMEGRRSFEHRLRERKEERVINNNNTT
jgi:hypothetical protein